MDTVHGPMNLNRHLADTDYFVVEHDDGFYVRSIVEGEVATMIPIRLKEHNTCCYYCVEEENIYSQEDIKKFFYTEQYPILPIESTTPVGLIPEAEELSEEFDLLDILL